MLVLSRRMNEKVLIGDEIVVSVVRVEGNQVRLGITAPREIRVLRSEIAPRDDGGRPRTWSDPGPLAG